MEVSDQPPLQLVKGHEAPGGLFLGEIG
jgi:hypothetical protein